MGQMQQQAPSPTIKKANSCFFWLLRVIFTPTLYLLYRFRFEKKTSRGIQRPCLILANHQTGLDQFGVGIGFRFGVNFVATDTIFRYGFLSKLMVALARPIPFSKGSSDLAAIKNMMAVIKDGGAVAMFPSGNRCCFGMESPMVPGIGKLAKMLKVPLVLVQIRGGYFTKPRWMAKPSKGKMRAAVAKCIPADDLAAMSADEISSIIDQTLLLNDFEYNKSANIAFRGRRKAEYLESMLFYCPQCASLSGLHSRGCEFLCRDCGVKARINSTGFFEQVADAAWQGMPDTILAWSQIQLDYIKNYDFSGFTDKPAFSDENAALYCAERAKSEVLVGNGTIALYADRLRVCGQDFSVSEITMTLVGARKLTIYRGNEVFAVIVPYRVNLMKYMICGYHLRNKALGSKEEFYGY